MSDLPRSGPVKWQQVNDESVSAANVEGPIGEPPASVAEFHQPLLGGVAGTMVGLLSNPDEALRLANSLYEEVKAKYTWQNAYEGYFEVIIAK